MYFCAFSLIFFSLNVYCSGIYVVSFILAFLFIHLESIPSLRACNGYHDWNWKPSWTSTRLPGSCKVLVTAERIWQGTYNYIEISFKIWPTLLFCVSTYVVIMMHTFSPFIFQALDSLQRAQELADGMGNKVTGVPHTGQVTQVELQWLVD